ncbi:MAG: hypothetical protein NVS4B10_18100 [Myxococcales bacterium]
MENRSFPIRALLLSCALVAGLIGAASLVGDEDPALQAAPQLTAAQRAELQPAAPPAPAARHEERRGEDPAFLDGEGPVDGNGS